MIKFKKDFNVKIVSLLVAVLFVFNSAAYGIDMSGKAHLRPPVGNSYERMLKAMQDKYILHNKTIDGDIERLCMGSKSLTGINLEKKFMDIIKAGGLEGMLGRLYAVFNEPRTDDKKPRIQVKFVDKESDLPLFEGKRVWGHAGTFITVFAVREKGETEEAVETDENIRKIIIGRIFHEIRARSTLAQKRFDEVNWGNILESEVDEKIAELLNIFEGQNKKIQEQIKAEGKISSESLLNEFKTLEFDKQASSIRDYSANDLLIEALEKLMKKYPDHVVYIFGSAVEKNKPGDIDIFLTVDTLKVIADELAEIGEKFRVGFDIHPSNYVLNSEGIPGTVSFMTKRYKNVIRIDSYGSSTIEAKDLKTKLMQDFIGRLFGMSGSPNKVFEHLSDGNPRTKQEIAKTLGVAISTIEPDLYFLRDCGLLDIGKEDRENTYAIKSELKGRETLIAAIQQILDKEFQYGMIAKNLRNPENRERITAEVLSIIISKIFKKGPITVNEVVAKLNVSETMAKQMLRLLVKHNFLIGPREGIYRCNSASGGSDENEPIEDHFLGSCKSTPHYLSHNYTSLELDAINLIKKALPDIISRSNIITIKSIGVGGDGHELYETAQIITDYLIEHNIRNVKIQLIAYDMIESKLKSARSNISNKLRKLRDIKYQYILIDLNDKEQYKVLVSREQADILFCRYTWLALNYNWDLNRQREFIRLLEGNVNEGGVVYIVGLGGNMYSTMQVRTDL